MDSEANKKIATDFLQMAARGEAKAAVRSFCSPNCKHHNPYFATGMDTLAQAMEDDGKQHPNKQLIIKQALADGGLVALHSHVIREMEQSIATVHLFRFEGDKIAEFWDIGQVIPDDSPNTDGMF
jgi:predicted SnoaL-like aldol condensation-catalyzing enzyme